MNLRDLHYVIAVADLGHFGRAADACHVSQPTLSGQIHKLEEELGVQLFERGGKPVRMTEHGAEIIQHARRIVAASADLLASARVARDPMDGPIRLGIISTVAPYLTSYLLPAAERDLPNAPIQVVENLTSHLLPPLLEGKLDAAIIATDPNSPRLSEIVLYDEPYLLLVGEKHRLAKQKSVTINSLDPKTLLLLTDGHCLRDQALDLCGHPDIGGGAAADTRAASLETLMQLTAAGYGVTFVPRLAVEAWRTQMNRTVAVPVKGADVSRRVRLVFRRDAPRHKAMNALAQTLRASLPACVSVKR